MKAPRPEIFLILLFLISFISAKQSKNKNNAAVIDRDALLAEDDEEIRNLTAALALGKQRFAVETTIILQRTRTVDVNKIRQNKPLLSRINLKIKQNLKKLAEKVRNKNRVLKYKIGKIFARKHKRTMYTFTRFMYK